MRRFVSVVLGASLCVFVATTAQAQIALGIRGGYNSSSVTIKENDVKIEGFKSRSGFHGGVDLAFAVSPMVGVEIGGFYSQKGFGEESTDATAKLDYIDIPLVVAINVPTNSQITPRIFLGGVGSIEMSCKLSLAGTSVDCTDEDFGARKSFYFSAIGGAGIAVAAGPGTFLIQGAYQLGLTNISDEEGVSAKGNAIQASVGYRFPVGG